MADAAEVAAPAVAVGPAGQVRPPEAHMTPGERAAGCLLGLATLAAAVWLMRRERRAPSLGPSAWRGPNAWLLALAGLLVIAGSCLDPAQWPRTFMATWTAAGTVVAAALCVAGFDMLTVRRRGLAERRATLAAHRAELAAEFPPPRRPLDDWRKPSSN